jgi:hypothetical protein
MEDEVSEKVINDVIALVVAIQKKFAHELSGVRNERRQAVKDALSKLVSERLEQ